MSEWQSYNVENHTVVGDLRFYPGLHSPQLDNRRNVLVWLPDGYATSDQRYPVVYMHDGQNLFDERTSYAGEWRVDETMQALASEGYAAIIVGLPNQGELRRSEYNPYPPCSGDAYIRFITETVKPLIDSTFRTQPDVAHTGIAGSSMGGLISLYGFLCYPAVFGFCGAFSTAFWFGNSGILNTIDESATGHGKIYLDVGTREGPTLAYTVSPDDLDKMGKLDLAYLNGVRHIRAALLESGYVEPETLLYIEDEGAMHRENEWARRLPDALRFLLPCER